MFKIKKTFFLAPLIILLFLVLYPSAPFVFSQGSNYIPLAPLPNAAPSTGTNFGTYAKGLFALLIGIAAVLAVIMIVIGGVEYMSTDAISGKSDGKDKITQALYGLFLAIACWLILYTINPKLLNFDIINSVPVSYNPTYINGPTPPSTPGFYLKYDIMLCVTPTSQWQTVYFGPLTQSLCNEYAQNFGDLIIPAICNTTTPPSTAQYQNISCAQVAAP